MSNFTSVLLLFFISFIDCRQADAAAFRLSSSVNCKIQLNGEIVHGDFAKFEALAKVVFPDTMQESTKENTVCLNSPGGNLSEGARFADYFSTKGVGTVIEADGTCASVCAIMFMMGTAQGEEVAFINRRMHYTATLAFHRPFLSIDSGEKIDMRALAFAYDEGMKSAMDLLSLANRLQPWDHKPMMQSDLIASMLEHVGGDLEYVDTVDKAGRWDIEVFGFPASPILTEEQAFYACENTLQWQVGTRKDVISYKDLVTAKPPLPRTKKIETEFGSVFSVTSPRAGYADAGCKVLLDKDQNVRVCGFDENTDVNIGGGKNCLSSIDNFAGVSVFHVHNPSLKLKELASLPNEAVSRAPVSRCATFLADNPIEEADCSMDIQNTGSDEFDAKFTWDTGGRTILSKRGGLYLLNGNDTKPSTHSGFDACLTNIKTGKDFCFR